jgi:uncharacterized integral membrane protein
LDIISTSDTDSAIYMGSDKISTAIYMAATGMPPGNPGGILIFQAVSVYDRSMRYVNIVATILFLLFVITFCVNNTQGFSLSFFGYRLMGELQLWMLMVIFFAAGMVPIIVSELPGRAERFMRIRALKARIRDLEEQLRGSSAGDPA